jgi:hypothetical protein
MYKAGSKGALCEGLLQPRSLSSGTTHNVVYVTRSALCLRIDGRYAYVTVGPVDAELLGGALIQIGCQRAIELDINGTWPTFVSFHPGPAGRETAGLPRPPHGGQRHPLPHRLVKGVLCRVRCGTLGGHCHYR